MSLLDDVKKNLNEWVAVTSEKTAEVAKVTSRRYDKWGVSRDIERHFSELGSLVYNGMQEGQADLLSDAGVVALVERISGLEAELEAKNEEIEAIRKDYAERKAKPAATSGTTSTVITDPVLSAGRPESPILVESEADEHTWDANQDDINPEKQG
jgi:hypothetical protein